MSGLLLSDAERKRFAEWLELTELSAKGLLEQASKVSLHQIIITQLKFEAAACHFLAHKLRTTESMSISGDE